MTHDEQIAALIEAGEKATQGVYTLEKTNPDDLGECLITFGGSLKSDIYSYSSWNNIKEKDAVFLAQAANSREAIRAMHTELLALRKVAAEMAEALEKAEAIYQELDSVSWHEDSDFQSSDYQDEYASCQEALTKYNAMKGNNDNPAR